MEVSEGLRRAEYERTEVAEGLRRVEYERMEVSEGLRRTEYERMEVAEGLRRAEYERMEVSEGLQRVEYERILVAEGRRRLEYERILVREGRRRLEYESILVREVRRRLEYARIRISRTFVNGGKRLFWGKIYTFAARYNHIFDAAMEKNLKEREWKVLSSEYVYRDTWLTARKDCVQLPTGAVIPKYYVLEYPDWVTTIAITREGEFIFVRQYRYGIRETRYELCAGVCDPTDASPMDAAKRELWEETGYGGGEWRQVMKISANASAMTNFTHCFVATGVERLSEPHQEATEDLSVHLLSLEEVRELLHGDEIKQATQVAPLWK